MQDALLYKPDYIEAGNRLHAFWEREIIDRVCIAVKAPRDKQLPLPRPANDREYPSTSDCNTNPEYLVRLYNAEMSNTYFGGEALPWASAPGSLFFAAWGGKPSIKSGTVWVDPDICSWEQWESYRFDPDNTFIQTAFSIVRALGKDAPGKYIVGSSGIFGPMDAMSMMRGMEDFVVELTLPECADAIAKAHTEVVKGFKYISEMVYELANSGDDDYVVYPGLCAHGRINYWSADFCCLIGPKQFQQWVIPEIWEMARVLEFSMYHLDGPDSVRHLPMILEIGELKGIQYTRGAGNSLAGALPVYKQIQQGGKVQYVDCAYDEVELVLQELEPYGLLIITSAPSVEAAEVLLRNVERWTAC